MPYIKWVYIPEFEEVSKDKERNKKFEVRLGEIFMVITKGNTQSRSNIEAIVSRNQELGNTSITNEAITYRQQESDDKKIIEKAFLSGVRVLKQVPPYQEGTKGKLKPTWEGPYIVSHVREDGSYILLDCEESSNTYLMHEKYQKFFFYPEANIAEALRCH